MLEIKIKSVNIQKFRGIIDTELQLEGKNILLKGDNGTGKTSIVSAIEFFFAGNISPLEGVQGLSKDKHGPHVYFNKDDSIIEITFIDNTSLIRKFSEVFNIPSTLTDLFSQAKKHKFILHRGKILEFILSPPAQKYRAISSIVGVDSLEHIEYNFKKIRDKLDADVNSLKEQYNRIIQDLSKLLELDIKDEQDIIGGLNQKLKVNGYPEIKSLEEIDEYSIEKFKEVVKKHDSEGSILKLNDILTMIQNIHLEDNLNEPIQKVNQLKETLGKEDSRIKSNLRDLLRLGYEVVREEQQDICPLCQQKIDNKILTNSIKNRLDIMNKLSEEYSELTHLSTQLFNNITSIIDKIKKILSNIVEIRGLEKYKKDLDQFVEYLRQFINKYFQSENYQVKIPKEEVSERLGKLNSLFLEISNKSEEIRENFKLTDEEKEVFIIINLLNEVRTKYKLLISFDRERAEILTQYNLANKLYNTFSKTKKVNINRIYQLLKNDIEKYYQFIHANDLHKNVDIQIDDKKRASVNLKIDSFNRTGEDPRAFTSEGHLDTLGICIFLAFVKKFNKFPLLILDDIVTTVDANHREKLARLLLNEFPEFQMIITTHDGIWYDQLCSNQRSCGVQNNFKNFKIIGWDINIGPKIIPYEPQWIKIQKYLDSGDFDVAGMLSRRYLEWILKEICISTKVALEYRREDRYTVGELFDNTKKRVKELMNRIDNGSEFKLRINKAFEDLETNQFMANLMAHDNPQISQLSDVEISNFCTNVHSLYTVFLCPGCNIFIKYEQELKEIRCINPKCKNPLLMRMKR